MSDTQLIRGRNVEISIYDEGISALKPYGCATGLSMEITGEQIETTTVNSGLDRDYVGGMRECTGSFEGVVTLDENPVMQYDELVDLIRTRQQLMVKFTNDWGDVLSYLMTALFLKVSVTANVTDFSSFTVEFIRCGSWVKVKTYNNILLDDDDNPVLDSNGRFIRVI